MKNDFINSYWVAALFILTFNLNFYAQNEIQKTEILVLATTHLNGVEGFETSMLDNVKKKLKNHDFDAICIERMSTEFLLELKSHKDKFIDPYLDYYLKWRLDIMNAIHEQESVSLSEARLRVSELLANEKFKPSRRKELMYMYLASGDIPSAALQLKYLMNRDSGFAKNDTIVENLSKSLNVNNEIYSLSLDLAYLLNIDKLYSVDNLTDEMFLLKIFPRFKEELMANQQLFPKMSEAPVYMKFDSITKSSVKSKDFTKAYEYYNSDEFVKEDLETQWFSFLKADSKYKALSGRYTLWEMRNLLIVANILKIASKYTGGKILFVVGASHKGFIDKYLYQIPNIKLLDY